MRKKLKPAGIEDKTVFLFPYFDTASTAWGCIRAYILRAVLACLVCVACSLTLSASLGWEADLRLIAFTITSCLFFGALNLISGKSALVVLLVAIIFGIVRRDELFEALENAADAFLSVAGGLTPDNECVAFIYIISAIFAFTCSFYIVTSYPTTVLTAMFAALFLIPSIISGDLSVSVPLVIMGAAVCACVQISLCYGVEKTFIGETRYIRTKEKKPFFFNGKKQLINQAQTHGRFSSEAFTVLICGVLVFSVVSSTLPRDARLDYKSVLNAITEFSQSVSDFFGFGAKEEFNGFFTADGSDEMKISNDITVSPGSSEKQVLSVTLSRPDEKVYLRGDIGYEFTGKGWRSISEIDYENLVYDDYRYDELFKSYATDLDYQLFRQRVFSLGYNAEQFLSGITLKVEYLCDTNTLFTPISPIDASFRDNEAFNVLGDYVANTTGKRRVSSYQTAALIPMLSDYSAYYLLSLALTYYHESDDSTLYYPNAMSYYEYQEAQEAYRVFISNYYLGVPEEEKENIRKYIHDVVPKFYHPVESEYELFPMMSVEDNARFAEAFTDEFHNSFRYSLTADNESGDNTMLGNFLFETKSGHCALYATALTLILREQGIPARYVTGFVVGGAGDKFEKTDDGYVFPVYESNLHAWTEVYIEGVGWLPFDATPPSVVYTDSPIATATSASETEPPDDTSETTERTTEISSASSSSDADRTTEGSSHSPSASAPDEQEEKHDNSESMRLLLIIGIILLCAVAVTFVIISFVSLDKRLKANEKKLFSRLSSDIDSVGSVRKMLRISIRLLGFEKIKKNAEETPLQFAQRIDGIYRIKSGTACTEAMAVFEKAEFSRPDDIAISDDERRATLEFVKFLTRTVVHGEKNPVVRFIRRYVMFRKLK